MGLSIPLWPTAFVFPLGLCFYYFLLAGSRTFEIGPEDDLASGIAQFSFFVTGMLATILLGYRAEITVWNAVAGAVLMAGALALYEWARQTIFERRFRIAWNGAVPEELCEAGPYRPVRHPLYTSYMLAFAASSRRCRRSGRPSSSCSTSACSPTPRCMTSAAWRRATSPRPTPATGGARACSGRGSGDDPRPSARRGETAPAAVAIP
jgi:protein-S-isoprenylcysteine O-methyltransferase Ste14